MMATGAVAQTSLAIAMIAVAVLGMSGIRRLRRGGPARLHGGLMLGVACVILGNVLIWAWP